MSGLGRWSFSLKWVYLSLSFHSSLVERCSLVRELAYTARKFTSDEAAGMGLMRWENGWKSFHCYVCMHLSVCSHPPPPLPSPPLIPFPPPPPLPSSPLPLPFPHPPSPSHSSSPSPSPPLPFLLPFPLPSPPPVGCSLTRQLQWTLQCPSPVTLPPRVQWLCLEPNVISTTHGTTQWKKVWSMR